MFVGDENSIGMYIEFVYNSQGERIVKRVLNQSQKIVKEINYVRDARGRTLIERELSFTSEYTSPDVLITIYIYGPKGLFGFIRRGEFHSVITDHEGSIRLVVKNGEVVAAYDYLPYGVLLRKYASYPEAHIPYRYTGQEWDEEIGLYNFHARFYDPDIGRFYQVDPKEQYYSPYVYAGNSPISRVDPDGEFAIAIVLLIAGLIAGAYLGGAATNDIWNPLEWDYSSATTWGGMVGGGITGALLPSAFMADGAFVTGGALAARLSVGTGLGYFGAAAANDEWNPIEWNWNNPNMYYNGFSGFVNGAAAVAGFSSASKYFSTLSTKGKTAFLGGAAMYGAATAFIYSQDKWNDPKNPKFWFELASGIVSATDLPMLTGKFANGLKNIKSFNSLQTKVTKIFKSREMFLKYAVKTAIIGATFTLGGFQTNWDMLNFGTYYNMIYGFVQGDLIISVAKGVRIELKNIRRKYNLNEEYVRSLNEADRELTDAVRTLRTVGISITDIVSAVVLEVPHSPPSELITVDNVLNGPTLTSKNSAEMQMSTSNKKWRLSMEKCQTGIVSTIGAEVEKKLINSNEFQNINHEISQQILETIHYSIHKNQPISRSEINRIMREKGPTLDVIQTDPTSLEQLSRRELNVLETRDSLQRSLFYERITSVEELWKYLEFFNRRISQWISIEPTIHNPLNTIRQYIPEFGFSDLVFTTTNHINRYFELTPLIQYTQSGRIMLRVAFENIVNSQWLTIVKDHVTKSTSFVPWRSIRDKYRTERRMLNDANIRHRQERQRRSLNNNTSSNVFGNETFQDILTATEQVISTSYNQKSPILGSIMQWFKNKTIQITDTFHKHSSPYNNSRTNDINASFEVDGTIMLIDVLIRKITQEKYIPKKDENISLLDAQAYALNIISEFEKMLEKIAKHSGLSADDITFDQFSTMKQIVHHIMNGTHRKIPKILQKAAAKSVADYKRSHEFVNYLENNIDAMLFSGLKNAETRKTAPKSFYPESMAMNKSNQTRDHSNSTLLLR